MSAFYWHLIDGEPVFLSFERSRRISNLATGRMDAAWHFKVHTKEGKERKEAKRLEQKTLQELRKKDFQKFQKDWVEFHLEGEEARENLFRLLSAYFSFHKKKALFRDLRPAPGLWDVEREIADLDSRWPYGKNYYLVFECKGYSVQYEVFTEEVVTARGTLREFEVVGHRDTLKLGKDVLVLRANPE